jgi:hypothetical protein
MEDEGYFVCGSPDHWAKKCPNRKVRKPQPKQKTVNMVVSSSGGGTSGYGNLSSVFQCFNLPLGGLILVQMFMCVLMLRCSLLTRSHASVHGVGMVDLTLTLGKIVQLKNV